MGPAAYSSYAFIHTTHQAKKRAACLRLQLGRTLELNEFEQLLATQVINPHHIEVQMQDVSGLESIIADLVS